ncbi:GNAT family N-acetyltransferase [SAR202 cluster bacterium AD-802-F09_MRT_200m]|nr:GNAT family N-acetyltransferase [SAR202 cluster bacterium AD-802-F09_MRT_200m]
MVARITVRGATFEDRRALWVWRNDPLTNTLFAVDGSLKYSDHCAWFQRVQDGNAGTLLIGLIDTLRIGAVYFRPTIGNEMEAGVFLKPVHSGKGYASKLLEEAVNFLGQSHNSATIVANLGPGQERLAETYRQAGFSSSDGSRCYLDI